MQKISQKFFRDRALYYTSRILQKQINTGQIGDNYQLPSIYFIGILNFPLDNIDQKYFYNIALCDRESNQSFYDKLGFKLIVLPNFNETPEEIETPRDQWIYFLKNITKTNNPEKYLDIKIFKSIFELGKINTLKKEERMSYEASIKRERDWAAALEYQLEKRMQVENERHLKKERDWEAALQYELEKRMQVENERHLKKERDWEAALQYELEKRMQVENEKNQMIIHNMIAKQIALSDEEIAELLDLPIEKVQEIRKEIDEK